jgi:hypothetical protein
MAANYGGRSPVPVRRERREAVERPPATRLLSWDAFLVRLCERLDFAPASLDPSSLLVDTIANDDVRLLTVLFLLEELIGTADLRSFAWEELSIRNLYDLYVNQAIGKMTRDIRFGSLRVDRDR